MVGKLSSALEIVGDKTRIKAINTADNFIFSHAIIPQVDQGPSANPDDSTKHDVISDLEEFYRRGPRRMR